MSVALKFLTTEPSVPAKASVIWLHGLGADGYDFYNIVPELPLAPERAFRFIFPHAPVRNITINANAPMRGWYDIYSFDSIDREDEQGIENSKEQLIELIEHEKQRGIPSQKIILAGFSQGGAIALYTGLRYAEPLAGILVLSSYLPLLAHFAQERHPQNANTPIFMAHGIYDPILPIQLGEYTYQTLKNKQYPIDWRQYPMEHRICAQELKDIGDWLNKIAH